MLKEIGEGALLKLMVLTAGGEIGKRCIKMWILLCNNIPLLKCCTLS